MLRNKQQVHAMIIESYKINIIDLIILAPLAWGAWRGWLNGFITQGFSLALLLLGIIAVIRISGFAADVVFPRMPLSGKVMPVVFFILLFAGIIFLTELFTKVVKHMVESLDRDVTNRVIGAGLGFIKYVFIAGIGLIIFEMLAMKLILNLIEIREHSFFYKHIHNFVHFVFNFNIKPVF